MEIKVLDKGFIRLIDSMGSDKRIVDSARISYGGESKGEEQDKKLLFYLYKNKHCFLPHMQVLTTEGWKTWKECKQEETFLVPDIATKELKPEKLSVIQKEVTNETIYSFKNKRFNYSVTEDHDLIFINKENTLSKIKAYAAHEQWNLHFELGKDYTIYDTDLLKKDPLGKLIGLYLSDGFASSGKRINFRLVKQRKIKYLEDILDELDIEYKKKKSSFLTSSKNTIYEYSILINNISNFTKYIDITKKAAFKRLEIIEYLNEDKNFLYGLLDGLINGDGSIKKDRDQIEFSSTSLELAKLFDSLANTFGLEAHFVKKQYSYHVKIYYGNRISGETRKEYFKKDIYTGTVYCTTTSTGYLLVRGSQNSYSFISGNCSPFEMCKVTVHIKMPIFVMRQYVRHRVQNLNEISFRYTEPDDDFYIPETWRKQDTKNKQGSFTDDAWEPGLCREIPIPLFNDSSEHMKTMKHPVIAKGNSEVSAEFERVCEELYSTYKSMVASGIAREMARMILPVNLYTEVYATWDLRNLLHFISLRSDPHAQYEIREYSKALEKIVAKLFPWTWEAYNKYKFVLTDTSNETK